MPYSFTHSQVAQGEATQGLLRIARKLAGCGLLAALVCAGARPAHATLIASETFTGTGYNNGATISGLNGGTGWAGAWASGNSGDTILSSGLSYSSGSAVLSSSGGKLQVVGGSPYRYFATGTGSPAQLAGVVNASGNIGATNTSVWVAYLGQCPVSGADCGITFTRPGASYGVPQTGILALGGPENWRFWPAANSTGIGAGNQILLVWRIDYGASSDSVHVWYNPTPGTVPTDASANLSYGAEDWSFNEITFGGNTSTTMWFDELRVGTTYADVAPILTALPAIPSNPTPADAASNVSTATSLDWADSLGAASYDVFLWVTSGSQPANPNATVTASTWTPPGLLTPLTNYSWRVVARNQFGPTNGPVWTFTTGDGRPATPAAPSPANGAASVLVDTTLSWTNSLGATGYQLYLWPSGSSQPSTPTATLASSTYLPASPLTGNTIYDWQVVATNAFGSTTGAVWTFTTGQSYPGYLVPWPTSVTMRAGDFQLTAGTRIVAANASLMRLAAVMTNDIFMATGLGLTSLQGTPQAGDIFLTNNTSLAGETYSLDVSGTNVVLSGSNYQAVAWASVTLLQALNTSTNPVTVPQMLITDTPASPLRAVMWDIARFYHPLETLYELVDLHRMYKVTYMNLMMSAEGLFTFGTTAYPSIATPNDSNVPYKGSPGFYLPATGSRLYYTKAELTNLVQYAKDRGVIIVPLLETPAHAGSMTSRDPSDFCSVGGTTQTTDININYSNAITAMGIIMGELADVFNTSPYIHIAVDEVSSSEFTSFPYWSTSSALYNWSSGSDALTWYMWKLSNFASNRLQTAWAWSAPGKLGKGYNMPTNMVYTAWGSDDGPSASSLGYWVMRAAGGHVCGMGQANNAPPYNRCLLYRPAEGIYNRLIPLLRYISYPDNDYTDLWPTNDWVPLTGRENKILGAHVMEFETPYELEVPAMRLSMPALGEPTWNQATTARLDWNNFLVRQEHTDQLYQRVMEPVVLSVTTQVDPKDICFVAGGMVTMTSSVPGTIRYTVGTSYANSWYNFPTNTSTAYTAPFAISQSSVISARLFDSNGNALGNPVTKGFYLITPTTHYKNYYTGDPAPADFESGTPIVSSVMGQMNGDAPQADVRYGDSLHRTVYTGSIMASAGAYTFMASFAEGAIYIDRVLVPDGVATTLTAGEHLIKIVTPASGLGTPYTFTGPGHTSATDINVLLKTLATAAQVFPASYAFGTQGIADGATAVQLVTIVNHNVFSNMVVSSVSLTGANASEFVISQDTGETVIAPGYERVVGVRFDPATIGSKTASLHVVASLLSGGSADVALTGTAVISAPPATPTTPSPTNAATGVDVYSTLDWADSSGATGYNVFLWPASGSEPTTPTATVTASQWMPASPLAYSTAYDWQVIATNNYGFATGAVWTFTTQPPQPPSTPITPTPANNATGVAITTTLDWADSTNASGYAVYFWLASGSQPGTPTATITASQWAPPANLPYGTSYYWQVVATNAYGSTPGAVWTFATTPLTYWVWDGGGSNNRWSTANNWAPNSSYPQLASDVAVFTGSTRPTISLNGNRTVNSIVFSNTTAPFALSNNILSLADGGMIDVQNTSSQNNNTIVSTVAMLGSLIVTNEKSGNTLTLSGALSGTGTLAIGGAGQTVLSVNGNSDQVGGLVSSGTPSTAVVKNGASSAGSLTINNAADCTFNGSMADGGTGVLNITKTNSGAFIITSPCTNTGAWTIGAGTLGGTGTVAGVVTVLSRATLSPGTGGGTAGTLTLNSNLVLNAGAVLNFHLGLPNVVGGGTNDLVTVGSDLTLDGTLNVTGLAGFDTAVAGSSWRLFNYSRSLTDNGLVLGAIPGSGDTYAIDTSHTNQVNLIVPTSTNGPAVPAYVSPANGATSVSLNTSLTWSGASAATGYKVYLWPASGSPPATPSATTADTTWTPGNSLSYTTAYDWQVVATNTFASSTGAVWTFSTTTNSVQVTNIAGGTTLRYPLVLVSGTYDGQSLAVTAVPTNAGVSLTTYGTRFRFLVDLQPGANTVMITDGHGPVAFNLTYTPATTAYHYKMWYVVPADEASTPVDTNYYTHFGLQAKLMQSWEAEDQLRGGHGHTTFYPEMDSSNNVNVGYLVLTQTRAQAEALGTGIFDAVYNQIPGPYMDGFHRNVVFSSVNFHALESSYMAYVGAYTNIHPNNVAGIMGALLSTNLGNDLQLTYATYAGVTLHEIGHTINSIWHDLNYPSIMSGTDYDISEYFTLTYSIINPTPHNECCAGTMGNQRDLVAWDRYLMSADLKTYNNTTVSVSTGPEYLSASSAFPLAVFYYYRPDTTTDLHSNLWTSGAMTFSKHLGRALIELGTFPFNIMAVDTQGNMSYTTFTGGTIPVVPVDDSYTVSGTTVIAAPGVLSNDINPSASTLAAVLATNVQHGALALSANGGFTYTPTPGFTGTDTFWYTAVDPISSDQQARVTITVPALTANAGSPQTVTPNVPSVTIGGNPTASYGSPPYSYSWSPATGLSSATVANPAASPTATTTYTVTVTDNAGTHATNSVVVTYVGGNAALVSVDFVTGGSNPTTPASGDTTASGSVDNPTGLSFTGQLGAWNAFNIDPAGYGNNTYGSAGPSGNLLNGVGTPSGVHFAITNSYRCSPGNSGLVGYLRNESASFYYGLSANPVTWQLTGLIASRFYQLVIFSGWGYPGTGGTHTANGVTAARDSEGDANWSTVQADATGKISGTLGGVSGEIVPMYGFQLQLAPPSQPPEFPASGFSRPNGVPTFAIPNTVSTSTYTLLYKNNLTDATWTPLGGSGTAQGNGGTLTLSDPTVVGSLPASRYYRLQRNP